MLLDVVVLLRKIHFGEPGPVHATVNRRFAMDDTSFMVKGRNDQDM
jgi:hypothetical protein